MLDDVFYGKDLPLSENPGNSPDRFQIIVRLDKGLPEQALKGIANSQGGRLEKLLLSEDSPSANGKGSIYVLSFPDTPAREHIVEALLHRPGIELAELDSTVHSMLTSNDTLYGNGILWGMLSASTGNQYGTGADAAWGRSDVSADGKVGSMRTVVGVIDTGIDPLHPDLYLNIWINQNEIPSGLATDQDGDGIITFRDLNVQVAGNYVNSVTDLNANGRIDADDLLLDSRWANGIDDDTNGYLDDLFGWDFRGNDNRPFEAYNGSGSEGNPADSYHGTHVAGTIGAQSNTFGVVGVNWDVQIMPMRFLGPPGIGGSTADALEAIYYYTAMGLANPELNFVGTNNSWGGGSPDQFLADAITDAGNNGHLFVVAAGNSSSNNNGTPSYPSSYVISSTFEGITYDPVIAVASIDSNGALSSFSNFGSIAVDIAAPGGNIASTLAGSEAFGGYTNVYLSGTSMASPHVTGAVALISSEFPGLHPADLKSAILNGRTAYTALNGQVATGGRLNIPGSIALVGPAPTITISDSLLTLADPSATVTFSFSEAVISFSLADISVSASDGTVSGLTTANNIVWTATFTPANVETQAAQILVGNRFTSAAGDFGRSGESAPFVIDRIAPLATVSTIAATKDGSGANIDGTLSAPLVSGEVLVVFRDGTPLGNATVNGANWHFDDTTALAQGTFQYTARPVDAVGNEGGLSSQAPLVIGPPTDFTLSLGIAETGEFGNRYNGNFDADGVITGSFTGAGQDLLLNLIGFDIDNSTEVQVLLNGASLGYLATTPNNGSSPSEFTIFAAQQLAGANVLSFVVGNPGWMWGFTDILLEPLPSADISLAIGALETGEFGNRFNGNFDADGVITASFTGSSQNLVLSLTGFDIDNSTEVQVLLNGSHLGYLEVTPDNGTAASEFTIFAGQQLAGTNTLSFVAGDPGWKWGFTDILLEPAPTADFALTLGATETGEFGNRYNGHFDADGIVTGSFTGTGQDISLDLTGFDIDNLTEVQVLLNGASLGYLAVTPNNGFSPSGFTILASEQLAGTNTLSFVVGNPGWMWGFTDITINSIA